MSLREQKPDFSGFNESPQKDLKYFFNPKKKNNFFQDIIKNNSHIGLT